MSSSQSTLKAQRDAVFFPSECGDEQTSLNSIKRIIATTVSAILYYRGVFDEDSFGEKYHRGVKLRILSNTSENSKVQDVVELLKGVFEAIGKKYLKQLTVAFLEDPQKPDDYLEAYFVKVTYSKKKTTLNYSRNQRYSDSAVSAGDVTSDDDMAAAALGLIQRLKKVTQAIEAHERQCFMVMRLQYNDDAPDDYAPDGYKTVESGGDFLFSEDVVTNNCGEVDTQHHCIKVKMIAEEDKFCPSKKRRVN